MKKAKHTGQEIKTLVELNEEELAMARKSLAYGKKLEDYELFRVHRNKHGELIRVATAKFTNAKIKEINDAYKRHSEIRDVLESMHRLELRRS